ncbi:peptide chain release factor N(5)-glutamine methyltransferase [Bernardetia sp.]|uniref:peptide chain release factor N(5)-glutamine methyltransferase n=1 Tax=Bernardetia sp. TaxID=1937974 RepID=UPI0025BF678D|nr:peptide chain release factor N(5)-glutamine methyltransferase [Bernardetia sp.]
MLISEFIKKNTQYLLSTNQTDEREVQTILRFLIEDTLQINRIDFSSRFLTQQEIEFLNQSVERLKNNEPLQHITKKAYFYGLDLEVSPNVLIPRPETEELVHQILKDFENRKENKEIFLEVGTGSGCISIALAKNLPNFHFIAIDISEKALEIAKKNAKKNNVENIEFLQLNFLDKEEVRNCKAIKNITHIVSNPPYIKENEKATMSANVLDYEPHIALFVENTNPLIFYKAIAEFFTNTTVNKNSFLYVEVNQYLAKETKELFISFGLENCIIFKDLQENLRFVRATYESF